VSKSLQHKVFFLALALDGSRPQLGVVSLVVEAVSALAQRCQLKATIDHLVKLLFVLIHFSNKQKQTFIKHIEM